MQDQTHCKGKKESKSTLTTQELDSAEEIPQPPLERITSTLFKRWPKHQQAGQQVNPQEEVYRTQNVFQIARDRV